MFPHCHVARQVASRSDHGLIRHGFRRDAALAEAREDLRQVFALDFERDDVAGTGGVRGRFRLQPFLRPREFSVDDAKFTLGENYMYVVMPITVDA